MGYLKGGYNSLKLLVKNPVAVLPDILWLVGIALTNYIFIYVSGVLHLIRADAILGQLMLVDWIRLIASIAVLVLTQFVLGAGIDVLRFSMVKDIAKNRKASIRKALKTKRHFYFKMIIMKFLTYCIVVVAYVPILALWFVARAYEDHPLFYIMLVALVIAAAIFLRLMLLFRNAVMFMRIRKPVIALKESFSMVRRQLKHTLIVWLVVTAVFVAVTLANSAIGTGFYMLREQLHISIIAALSPVLGLLLERIYKVWDSIYVFRNLKP